MAKKVIVELVDDIDGSLIREGKGEQVTFAVDGVSYQIDLGEKNAKEFHRQLDFYIEHATKLSGRSRRRSTIGAKTTAAPQRARSAEQSKAIRDWAAANGYTVSSRGRISAEIEQAFAAAH